MTELPPDVMKRQLDHCKEHGYRENTLEVQRLIRKYNRQVKKLLAVFKIQIWKDDCQVYSRNTEKYWTSGKPGAQIGIETEEYHESIFKRPGV
jgi:hypothetical protein